jgi:hypothetical protein
MKYTTSKWACFYFLLIRIFRDIKRKAKRWDNKQVDSLKKKRDQYVNEIKDLQTERRKDSNLQDLKSQINGLEARLKYTKRDKETIVRLLIDIMVFCLILVQFWELVREVRSAG